MVSQADSRMLKPIAQSEIEKAANDLGIPFECAELIATATDRAIEKVIRDLFAKAGYVFVEHEGELSAVPISVPDEWVTWKGKEEGKPRPEVIWTESPATPSDNPPPKA